ncbi:hypothetical protein CAPTEDRAFT_216556, partial [Capitella teleta]
MTPPNQACDSPRRRETFWRFAGSVSSSVGYVKWLKLLNKSTPDGFQKARNKRRKRKKALIGANEDSSLGLANEPSRSVFVARFPKETKTESIAQYATKNGITVRKVERMSKEDAPQASFRVM